MDLGTSGSRFEPLTGRSSFQRLPEFDGVDEPVAKSSSRWERFKGWIKANPKKSILFAALIALGIVLLILIPLALALLPLMDVSVGRSSTFMVDDLCSQNATFGFRGSIIIPGTVTVVVTRNFTVQLLQNRTLFAELDIPGPITLSPGEVVLLFERAQRLRVMNETQLAIMIQSILNKAPGTALTIKVVLPVRIYGGISLNFPVTYHMDLFGKTSTTTAANTTASNSTVSLASLEVPQSDVNAFVARLGLDIVGTPMVEAQVPDLAFDILSDAGTMATVGSKAFFLNGNQKSSALTDISMLAANVAPAQQQVTTAQNTNRLDITVQGSRTSSNPACMAHRVLSQVQAKVSVPLSTATTATTRSARASPSSPPLFSLSSIEVDTFDSTSFLTRLKASLGFKLIGQLPSVSAVVFDKRGSPSMVRLDLLPSPVAQSGPVSVTVKATVLDLDVTANTISNVVNAVSNTNVSLSGDPNPAGPVISRVLSAWSLNLPLTGAAPAQAGGLKLGNVGVTSVDNTRISLFMEVPISFQNAFTFIQLPVTPVRFSSLMTLAISASAQPVSNSTLVTMDMVVDDVARLTQTLQRAMDNDVTLGDVDVVGGDATATAHVASRLLNRVKLPKLALRQMFWPASSPPVASPTQSPVGLSLIELRSLTATLASLRVSLRNTLTGRVSGSIPTQTLLLQQTAPTARTAGQVDISMSLADVWADLSVTATPAAAASTLQDLVQRADTVGIVVTGAPPASPATANVIARVLAGLSFFLKRPAAAAPAPGATTTPTTPSSLALVGLDLIGNEGTQDAPIIVVDAILRLGEASSNTLFKGIIPSLSVAVAQGATSFIVVTTPQNLLAPGITIATTQSIRAAVTAPGQLGPILDSLFSKAPVSLTVRGDGPSNNLIQSILNAFTYTASITAPTGQTVGGGGVLPSLALQYVSSSANLLTISASYPFSNPSSITFRTHVPQLSAIYQGETVLVATVTNPPPGAVASVAPGANTVSAQLRAQADTPARRTRLEGLASDFLAAKSSPLMINGVIPAIRGNPIVFSYAFTLPASANGATTSSDKPNELVPCFEMGLTTPFDGAWSTGKCVPLTGCRCGLNDLCAVGRSSSQCSSSSVTSRCVDNKVSIIAHLYVKNPLPLTLRLDGAEADLLFDYSVAGLGAFANTRNKTNVLLTRLVAPGPSAPILNTLPLVVAKDNTEIISLWIRDANLAPPPADAFTGTQPQPITSPILTGVLLKESYTQASKVPLKIQFQNAVLRLRLEDFVFAFRMSYSYSYASTSLIPDFILNHNLTCAWKTGKRPPCWTGVGTKAPNCFVDHFAYPCIAQGSPVSQCGALGPVMQTFFPGGLKDVCCRDFIAQGLNFPTISTLCYDTEQQRTGTFRENKQSCPPNLIEGGFQKDLLEWRLL